MSAGFFLARFDDRYSVVFPVSKSMFFSQFEQENSQFKEQKKTGEKITKYRHFTMFMFVVERAGPNSPNDTREITKYCKLPKGNVPLQQFSRIYSRRCRGVCNKHTWFILLVPYSGVLILIKRGTFLITKKVKACNIFSL